MKFFSFCLVLSLICNLSAAGLDAQGLEIPVAEYGTGSWAFRNFGNHRALVTVEQPGNAVKVLIPWRRHDKDPEKKAVLVYDPAGKAVINTKVIKFSSDAGEIIFEAKTAGDYAVYYMPFTMGTGIWDDNGTYIEPKETASADWLKSWNINQCPEAKLKIIQAVGDFHRFDPMEIVPTQAELDGLKQRQGNPAYMLFPEDRIRPIRMLNKIPVKFLLSGPAHEFNGKAQPDEYYPFQIAVWASGSELKNLKVSWSDLAGASGSVIPAAQITCINTEGTGPDGKYFTKNIDVAKDKVQPLWILVTIPPDTKGEYTGKVTIQPENGEAQTVDVKLLVDGEPVKHHGAGDLWRMSRLAWLNSTLGNDDESLEPFTPLELNGNRVKLTLTEILFANDGLPEQIVTNEQPLLKAPVHFTITAEDGSKIVPANPVTQLLLEKPAAIERETTASANGLATKLHCRLEQDGAMLYTLTLLPEKSLPVKDISLTIPLDPAIAKYEAGFGVRGGIRTGKQIDWKWNIEHANYQYWAGDAAHGLQLKLSDDVDTWPSKGFIAESWDNQKRGGARVVEENGMLQVTAFSGSRVLEPGKEFRLRFRLMTTPAKPLSASRAHWSYRYAGPRANIMNFFQGWPGNSYINFPFLEVPKFRETVDKARNQKGRLQPGSLEYGVADKLTAAEGRIETETRLDFAPGQLLNNVLHQNQQLWSLKCADNMTVNCVWYAEIHGLMILLNDGKRNTALARLQALPFAKGSNPRITLEWNGSAIKTLINGKEAASVPVPDAWRSLKFETLRFPTSMWAIGAVKINNFDDRAGGKAKISGAVERSDAYAAIGGGIVPIPVGVNLYYTLRELTSRLPEIWALRSLGNEIYEQTSVEVYAVGKALYNSPGGGDPWLQEHLVDGYVTAWRQPLWNGQIDAAIGTAGKSRFHNYYVEGINYLMQEFGIDGMYLDGIGFTRDVTRRMAPVMQRNNPDYRLDLHSYDPWNRPGKILPYSAAQKYMEHLPYMRSTWFGEYCDYSRKPDYFLIEVSGIPFGVMNDMLDSGPGIPPFRGMVYGMTGRQHPSAPAMYDLWDSFAIADAQMKGYWEKNPPVKTRNHEFRATAYVHPRERTMIAVGHWPDSAPRNREAVPGLRTTPIRIDGKIDPAEWANAVQLSGFFLYQDTKRALPQTRVYVTYDSERLYIAFNCMGQGRRELTAKHKTRDDSVWEDDAMEFLIQPDPKNNDKYFHFIGNSAGVFYDAEVYEKEWNGDWEYKVNVGDDSWSGELSVSWKSLNVTPDKIKPGFEIAFNAFRDYLSKNGMVYSTWSPTQKIHHPESFGLLTLDKEKRQISAASQKSVAAPAVQLEIDFTALGLDPAKVKAYRPAIEHMQQGGPVDITKPIDVTPGTGAIIILEAQK